MLFSPFDYDIVSCVQLTSCVEKTCACIAARNFYIVDNADNRLSETLAVSPAYHIDTAVAWIDDQVVYQDAAASAFK